jgi:hypothetical protein
MTIASLNLFQLIALGVVGCLLVLTILVGWRGWITRRECFTWTMLWLASGFALLFPSVLSAIAKKMGIGRGADLLLYCAVVVMMIGFLMIYVRLRRLRREMTLLVRHLAIREATRGDEAAMPLPGDKPSLEAGDSLPSGR